MRSSKPFVRYIRKPKLEFGYQECQNRHMNKIIFSTYALRIQKKKELNCMNHPVQR